MYALSTSDEGDCYLCVPPDPGIEAAALGADEAAALGASASATPGAGESALSGTASAQVLHTFTLDSGTSRSFFRDERYFLLVVDDYSRYTTVFPLRSKGEVTETEAGSFPLPVWEPSDVHRASARPSRFRPLHRKNGIAERRIGMVMDVARTSMIHAAAPHFLWPFAVQYAAHQLNLQARVSLPETSPTLLWTGKVGDASAFRVWGSRAFVRDLSADKLSPRATPCVFLGFPPDAPGWQFYHPTSRRVLSSQDVTFDESVLPR
ncbi:unnamed protein product [Closterium sp. NIES-54]